MEINKEKINREIESFLQEKYPTFFEEFEVFINPISAPNIANLGNLIQVVYLTYLSNRMDACSLLYFAVSNFLEAYKEDTSFIDKIWNGEEKNGIPVPTLEILVARDMSNAGFKVSQKYHHAGETYVLGELNILLQSAKKRFFGSFIQTYIKHDVNIPFQMPIFSQSKENESVMKQL